MKVEKGRENKVLRTVSKPVKLVTPELRNFAADMIETMNKEKGVGIAAPQVGRNIRLVICKLNPGEANEAIIPMANPVILQASEETCDGEEGCLSLPGQWGNVKRAKNVLLRYKNMKNQDQTLELNNFNARIIQHEIDHIDGILFIDRATDLKEKTSQDKKGL